MSSYAYVKQSTPFAQNSTVVFSGGNTKGNFIIVFLTTYPSQVTGITDSEGNSGGYTKLADYAVTAGEHLQIWIAPVTVGGSANNTLTTTPSGNAYNGIAVEFSGTLPNPIAVDQQTSGATGASATGFTASISPTGKGNLYLLAMVRAGGGESNVPTANDGFTVLQTGQAGSEAYLANANGTQAVTVAWGTNGSVIYYLYIDIAAGLAGVPNSLMLMGVGT